MIEPPQSAPPSPPPGRPGIRLPLARPVITNVLLALIVLVFVVETVLGGSTSIQTLVQLGAQVNSLVAQGGYWRLLAAMFLHIGLMHLAFNGWALYSLGRDVEAFYGSWRFTSLYFLSGLLGGVASYVLGPNVASAGASGAIFGLIGAEVAYFLCNRRVFGVMGRQRLGNLAVLVAINLVFGFTVPGINNLAHLGGLVGGFVLGMALSPRYAIEWNWADGVPAQRLANRTPGAFQALGLLAICVMLVGGIWLGNQRWGSSSDVLLSKAEEAIGAQDLPGAQGLLERAVEADPSNVQALYELGRVHALRNDMSDAISAWEKVLTVQPDEPNTEYLLGQVYAQLGRDSDARDLLTKFIEQEPTGDRTDHARQILAALP